VFRVARSTALTVARTQARPSHVAVTLDYPRARRDVDLLHRPAHAKGGTVRFTVGRRTRVVRSRTTTFNVRARGRQSITVPAGAARDRFGNVNGKVVIVR
jgi:hypothetical protein